MPFSFSKSAAMGSFLRTVTAIFFGRFCANSTSGPRNNYGGRISLNPQTLPWFRYPAGKWTDGRSQNEILTTIRVRSWSHVVNKDKLHSFTKITLTHTRTRAQRNLAHVITCSRDYNNYSSACSEAWRADVFTWSVYSLNLTRGITNKFVFIRRNGRACVRE